MESMRDTANSHASIVRMLCSQWQGQAGALTWACLESELALHVAAPLLAWCHPGHQTPELALTLQLVARLQTVVVTASACKLDAVSVSFAASLNFAMQQITGRSLTL
jgi:hypothetical protein